MRTLTKEDVLPDLREAAFNLVKKIWAVGAVSRVQALKIVASASRSLAEELDGRANGSVPDEE